MRSLLLTKLKGMAGTNINNALLTALDEEPDPKRPRIIVFLTDGEATVGTTDPIRILKNVANANKEQSRFFVFGVGYKVNVNLLDKMAEQNGGTRQYVRPNEDLEVAVSSFFTKVSEPVLVNLALDIQNIKTKNLYPQKLPHLFRGSQVTVLGRYVSSGKSKLILRGDINGKQQEFSNAAQFPRQEPDHQFLPRLWAQRKVAYLVDEVRLNGENKELIDEIVRLSEKYGIMTPYTSFLVTEEQDAQNRFSGRGRTELRRRARVSSTPEALNAPQGSTSPVRKLSELKAEQAVSASTSLQKLQTDAQIQDSATVIKQVKSKTFHLINKVWVDSTHNAETKTTKIEFGSEKYFELLKKELDLAKYLAIGKHVIVIYKGTCYEIHPPKEKQD